LVYSYDQDAREPGLILEISTSDLILLAREVMMAVEVVSFFPRIRVRSFPAVADYPDSGAKDATWLL
jgi:hypothetical protein